MLYSVERRDGKFSVQVTFDLVECGVASAIYLDVPGFCPQMISGFPRCLLGHDAAACEYSLLSALLLSSQASVLC